MKTNKIILAETLAFLRKIDYFRNNYDMEFKEMTDVLGGDELEIINYIFDENRAFNLFANIRKLLMELENKEETLLVEFRKEFETIKEYTFLDNEEIIKDCRNILASIEVIKNQNNSYVELMDEIKEYIEVIEHDTK